uniref:BPL/LPL catalytic domain-containing protein n=1 Tax=Aegilops tauschii subsp. strangulata TaxID=200361 RepID=A0A453D6Q0_AEGTS
MTFGSVIERNVARPLMRLVTMGGAPILQQLHLEERLLRRTSDNWCIVNDGTAPPTIVMGVSGKVSELVKIRPVLRDHVPVVRRFSGGGTVIVDQGMVNVHRLHMQQDCCLWVAAVSSRHHVMDRPAVWFRGFGEFHLRENGKEPNRFPVPHERASRSVFTEGITAALGDHFTVQHRARNGALRPRRLRAFYEHDDFVPSTKVLSLQDLQDIMSKESPTAQRVQGWPR